MQVNNVMYLCQRDDIKPEEFKKKMAEKNLKLLDVNKNGVFESNDCFLYKVKDKDTAYSIARQMGVDMKTFKKLNKNIPDLSKIKAGETSLKVPFTEKLLKELGIVLSEEASTALINPDIKQQKNVTKTTDLPDKKDKTAKKTVMLDAGHGYKFDSGAVSNDKSVKESELTQKSVEILKSLIEAEGFNVIVGKRESLQDRQAEKIKQNPDYYISIHMNSCVTPNTGRGEEVLYTNDDDFLFASALREALAEDKTFKKRKIKKESLCVLRNDPPKTKSAMVEVGFINNDDDLKKLTNDTDLKRQLKQVVKGLKCYDNAN